MAGQSVVTGFLRNEGDILLLHRSEAVGSFAGKWAGVSGFAEGDPDSQICEEIREETGIDPDADCELVDTGEPFVVTDESGRTWHIHPYLFESSTREVQTDWESTASEWVPPPVILDRETVPDLWESYDRVRPTVERIESDTAHGSAYISRQALAVLRDEAALLASGRDATDERIEAVGSALLAARPAMTVVRNRINRVLFEVANDHSGVDLGAVESTAHEAIKSAIKADTGAAANLAPKIDGKRVATLSRSGTVLAAFRDREPDAVLVAESRPGTEGVEVANQLSPNIDVTLTTDAAFPHQLVEWGADLFVVGADTVFPDGTLLNKAGTRPGALSAASAGISVLVGTATDKISHDRTVDLEERAPEELYSGPESIGVRNPTFDLTPPGVIDQFVTEQGAIDPTAIAPLAAAHERHAGWRQ